MVKLSEIFASKTQAALIEHLLDNKGRFYNQSALASTLGVSSSTIARLIENLAKLEIVKYERFDRGVKVIALNDASETSRILMNFHSKIKCLEIKGGNKKA
ncbi:MAG: helix-turn-helix domain-containing protein [Candidatus Bathyarchaeia archaeon]|nr:MarR family transcriptional regulator [Candidatus Bathyarchaeota archaeon]